MTQKLSLFSFILFVLTGSILLSAQNSDHTPDTAVMQAVEAAFPKGLWHKQMPASDEDSQSRMKATCATVFSRKSDGTPELVLAGYNGDDAEVAMLAYESGKASIIEAVTDRDFFFGGEYCGVSIINLANPEHPSSLLAKTVAVSYNGQDWYFVWDGKKLRNITALDHDPGLDTPNSAMPDSYVVDIDHSGTMQIIGNNEDADKFPQKDGISSSGTLTLFRYNDSSYAAAKTLLFLANYEPQPPNWSDSMNGSWTNANIQNVDMHQTPASSYHLRIVNGDRDGQNRVTGARVEINGVTVVMPYEVDQHVETLERTIQLQKQNKIKVTVDGSEKSHLYVIVE
jgi:hypothetical protein